MDQIARREFLDQSLLVGQAEGRLHAVNDAVDPWDRQLRKSHSFNALILDVGASCQENFEPKSILKRVDKASS